MGRRIRASVALGTGMIISRTPFRISFFGGGTDYPVWFRDHGGAVLATSINKYCYLTCRYLPPFFEHRIRVVYSKIENCQKVDEIQHPAAREILRFLKIERGVEIHHDGDLPARSGMGSSSAFTVGLLHGLYALQGIMPSKERLAREGIHLEQDLLQETVGCQDQVLTAYGGLNHVTFLQNGDFCVRPLTLPARRQNELNDHLMLFYSGVDRFASEVASTVIEHLDDKRRQLRILKEMVDEAIALLNSDRPISEFGALLHEAWQAKRSLSTSVSSQAVDEIYAAALAAGASGGKVLGAGGGGFIVLFVPPGLQAQVRKQLKSLVYVPFRFECQGSQILCYEPEEEFGDESYFRRASRSAVFAALDKASEPERRG